MKNVDQYIEWANNAGLKVVIGFSKANDGGDSWCTWEDFFFDPPTRERFYDAWTMLLNRYRDVKNIVGWSVLHVPNHASTDWVSRKEIWNHVMTPEIITRIRNMSDKWLVWEPVGFKAQDLILLNDTKVVYTCNFYNPGSVTHQKEEYTWTKERFDQEYELRKLLEFKKLHDVPVYVGEFGVKWENSQGKISLSRLRWVQHALSFFSRYDVSWSYWVYGHAQWQFDLLKPDGNETDIVGIMKRSMFQDRLFSMWPARMYFFTLISRARW